jgi:hypothetical protein
MRADSKMNPGALTIRFASFSMVSALVVFPLFVFILIVALVAYMRYWLPPIGHEDFRTVKGAQPIYVQDEE